MTEKQLTPEELETLKNLQSKTSQITLQFGQLYLSKNRLEEQEAELKNYLKTLEQEESNLAKSLSDKYGNGTLDLDTGKITLVEE
jgi:uncharacterized protein (DUF3084 family)